MEVASLIAALVTAVATAVLGWLGFRLTRQADRRAAERTIGDLANGMGMARLEHPEMMRVAHRWTPETWTPLYEGTDPDLTRYYAYTEIGLEFCNAVLRARATGHIDQRAYDERYGRLVRLFLTENRPIVSTMLQENPYVSRAIVDEVNRLEASGWDWDKEFRDLRPA